jgi:hypothetical protein
VKYSIFVCILCGSLAGACGRKGPPLAPIVYVPRPVTELVAKRVEDEIVLQFKVPTANTNNSSPADLDRLEVYAHTGPLPAAADFLKYGTLVHRIEIKQPPREEQRAEGQEQGEAGAEGASAAPDAAGATPPAAPPQEKRADVKPGLIEQGWSTSVREALTEKHMEIGLMPPIRPIAPVATTATTPATTVETLETPGTVNFAMPVARYYTIVGVSRSRHRRGPYAGPIRVPLIAPLQAPEKVDTTYTADAISLSWVAQPEGAAPATPAAAPVKSVVDATTVEDRNQETPGTYEIYTDVETEGTQDAPRSGNPPASKPAPRAAPRFGYNVYDAAPVSAPEGAAASASATADKTADMPNVAVSAPVIPLNAALLTVPAFSDPRVEFGVQRCYIVRRVEMAGQVAIESAPSPPACVTPVDKFPPAAPKTVNLVSTTSAVSLIWEPNTEPDLAGYVILRGEAPGDKLAPLTPAPIGDAAYVDTSIRRNRTYVYEVIAVDKVGNRSAPSNRVEETIR